MATVTVHTVGTLLNTCVTYTHGFLQRAIDLAQLPLPPPTQSCHLVTSEKPATHCLISLTYHCNVQVLLTYVIFNFYVVLHCLPKPFSSPDPPLRRVRWGTAGRVEGRQRNKDLIKLARRYDHITGKL